MKTLKLYFKHQTGYLLFLLGIFVIPLGLYLEFSPYKAPKLPITVLGVMLLSQYAFYREKDFKKKIESRVQGILKKEMGRVPSRSEIIQRSGLIIKYRGVSIVLSGLVILCLMVLYKEF